MTTQLINRNGKPVANQFISISNGETTFQSYSTIIAKKVETSNGEKIILDTKALDYSQTTTKHLVTFLGYDSAKELRSNLERFTFENLN